MAEGTGGRTAFFFFFWRLGGRKNFLSIARSLVVGGPLGSRQIFDLDSGGKWTRWRIVYFVHFHFEMLMYSSPAQMRQIA